MENKQKLFGVWRMGFGVLFFTIFHCTIHTILLFLFFEPSCSTTIKHRCVALLYILYSYSPNCKFIGGQHFFSFPLLPVSTSPFFSGETTYFIECKATLFPSLSSISAQKPKPWPMSVFSIVTLPPESSTLSSIGCRSGSQFK